MSNNQFNNKRIAKNTIMLYLRMLLNIVVSLYTSRVVLQTLGVEDYGTYCVVVGVVGMFAFLNTAMAGATSRFLTLEIGRAEFERLKKTFSSALIVHLGISLVIFLLAETIGLWFLCNKLVIPEGRMFAAHIVYQCSIIGMFFSVTQVPYSATIMAHEKMDIYAYIELLNAFLKLGIVYVLMISNFDRLILYSLLVLIVQVFTALVYRLYCVKNYQESEFVLVWDKQFLKPLLNFSGWNLLSEAGFYVRTHGSNMSLNILFGTVVNAAGGIAATIQGVLLGFIVNIITAVRPPIIKAYGNNEYDRMNHLMVTSVKFNLFLTSLVTLPLMVDMHFALSLWLGEIPPYSVDICRLLLTAIFITSMSQVITIGMHAKGELRESAIVRNIVYISTPFIIYFCTNFFEGDPIFGYFIIVISQLLICLLDVVILSRKLPFVSCKKLFESFITTVGVVLVLYYVALRITTFYPETFLRVIIFTTVEIVVITVVFFCLIFERRERHFIYNFMYKVFKRIH